MKKLVCALLCATVIFSFGFFALASSDSDSEEPQKVETNQNTTGNTESTAAGTEEVKNAFFVGETAELKGVQATLVSVTQSEGSDFNEPTEGNVFVLCEFEITNNSDEEVNISSIMSFEAYCDDYACSTSISALLEKDDKGQLDGTVAPGKKLNGVIGYEVPADWGQVEIVFTPDVWSSKGITFIAENS